MELSADPPSAPPPAPSQPVPAAAEPPGGGPVLPSASVSGRPVLPSASVSGRPVVSSVPGSELEAGVQALLLAAQLSGADLWQQVQAMPVLFARGGLFYRLAERDVGLTDGKHISLQALPGKVRSGLRILAGYC